MKTEREIQIDWLRKRQNSVGASEVPVLILGTLFKKTALEIYIGKKIEITEPWPETEDTRRGHLFEPLAGQMYASQYGTKRHKAFFPSDKADHESDDRWFGKHPKHDHRTVNYDGLSSDGWVLEIKCPRQRVADYIDENGLRDYYMIQALYQAGIAHDQGTFAFKAGKCKGTKVIVMHPERAKLTVVDVPIDHDFLSAVNSEVDRFWFEHVVANRPPMNWENIRQPEKPTSAAYVDIEGDDWSEMEAMYSLMDTRLNQVKRKRDQVKKELIGMIQSTGETKLVLPGGTKVICVMQPGRRTFNTKLAKLENPDIDWAKYEEQGKPFLSFRTYWPKVQKEDVELDVEETAIEVGEDLQAFAKAPLSLEEATDLFDALRDRAELQIRSLELEKKSLEDAIALAEQSVSERAM